METDAADGNPLTTRIPTAAWKAQNAFHSSHKARRRFTYRIHFFRKAAVHLKHAFFWSEGWGAPQTIKRQVCQYQTVSTEGFTPNGASFLWQHGNDACVRSNRLAQREIGIERKALYLVCRDLQFHFGGMVAKTM